VRFSFEDESLEFMPLDVRRKLDLAGVKLSLAEWQRLSLDQRRELVDADDALAVLAMVPDVERFVPVSPWRSEEALLAIEEAARALSIALDRKALDDRGRYALHYLATRDEARFRAAIAELGVAY
jgi:hypothetical protein